MHELSERAELVRLHGRAQAIPSSEIDRILLSIDSLDDGPRGWATVWARAADVRLARGDHAGAMARLNLARFPFPSTAEGRRAHARCVAIAADIAAGQGLRGLTSATRLPGTVPLQIQPTHHGYWWCAEAS